MEKESIKTTADFEAAIDQLEGAVMDELVRSFKDNEIKMVKGTISIGVVWDNKGICYTQHGGAVRLPQYDLFTDK